MSHQYRPFEQNVSLLKQKASSHSILGVIIALAAIVIATLLSAYFTKGDLSLASLGEVQKTNTVLWVLDGMPFIFAFWGQYVSFLLSHEASVIIMDQTQELRKQTEVMQQKAAYDATHDALTRLPNRSLFIDRLQQATSRAKRDGTLLAVFILDIDRFKDVNDSLGSFGGDRLLKLVASRLTGVIREADTLARIGGDEFGFIFQGLKQKKDTQTIAYKIKKSLAAPFTLENLSFEIQGSIGASLFPEHGKGADTLMQRADVALWAAKKDNLGFVSYNKDLDNQSPHRLTLVGDLRNGINNDELLLHYQPKIDSRTSQLQSVEALVRWEHPVHGLIPPDEFIPLAERTGIIEDLTIWVLKNALHQGARWHNEHLPVGIAVNISSRCLLDPDFPEVLTGLLASYDFPAGYLTLEITETSIMYDPDRSMTILSRIHAMGVQLSIDDFGTGYSSLAYLKKLPVSELKIDKSFVMDMLDNESDAAIVNATIQLGHNLGLKVIAEGVEDRATMQRLCEMGCDQLQGYLFSRPLPPDQLTSWAGQEGAAWNCSK